MKYVYARPASVSFTDKGLLGYTFGPLKQDLDVYYIESEKGHEFFMISKRITRTYYVLSGTGYFTIDGSRYDVTPGMLVEVPTGVEYCYSGKMTLMAFCRPRWYSGNDRFTKWNPGVVGEEYGYPIESGSWLTRMRLFGKSPSSAWLRANKLLWDALPSSVTGTRAMRRYGTALSKLARVKGVRAQAFSTYFLRNRPQLELIRRLLSRWSEGETIRVSVIACSIGAEPYSIAWAIHSDRPDVKLALKAVDCSPQAVEFAERGVYSRAVSELAATDIFERMTPGEIEEMFQIDGATATVKPWVREGIEWGVEDAGDPQLSHSLGPQDIVVANNFLCHMSPWEAERCLRNIARLVAPQGYLIVAGIDLDVRTKVACDLGWTPVQDLLGEIHEGDACMRELWPFHYGGLEPLDRERGDWKTRYAAVFQVGTGATSQSSSRKQECGEGCLQAV